MKTSNKSKVGRPKVEPIKRRDIRVSFSFSQAELNLLDSLVELDDFESSRIRYIRRLIHDRAVQLGLRVD